MPVLKFWKKPTEKLVLDNLVLEDITDLVSTINLVDFASVVADVTRPVYQVDNNIYMITNDFAFTLLGMFSGGKRDAVIIRRDANSLIIVPPKSYVFWNGKSVEPVKYDLNKAEDQIKQLCGV